MKYSIVITSASLLLAHASFSAAAEQTRLAYSKKDQVEIFADQQQGKWCQKAISLNLVSDSPTELQQQTVDILLNKLTTVVNRECPTGEDIAFKVTDRQEQVLFQGSLSKSQQWQPQYVTATNPVANTSVAPAAAEQAKAEQAAAEQAAAEQAKAEQAKAEQAKAEQAKAEQAKAEQAAAEQAKAEQAKAEQAAAEQAAAEQAAAEQAAAEQAAAEQAAAEQAAAEQAAAEQAAAELAAAEQAALFELAGWKPELSRKGFVYQGDKPDQLIKDKTGCLLYAPTIRVEDRPYVRVTREGGECIDGHLNGVAKLKFKRQDGKNLGKIKAHFLYGYPFKSLPKDKELYPVARINQGHDILLMWLGSDPKLKQHYFVPAVYAYNGLFQLSESAGYVMTSETAAFMDEDLFKPLIAESFRPFTDNLRTRDGYTVYFVDGFPDVNKIHGYSDEHKLYSYRVNHHRKKGTYVNWDRTNNFYFERTLKQQQQLAQQKAREEEQAKRLAEQEAREAERKAQQRAQEQARIALEMNNTYERLTKADKWTRIADGLQQELKLFQPAIYVAHSYQHRPLNSPYGFNLGELAMARKQHKGTFVFKIDEKEDGYYTTGEPYQVHVHSEEPLEEGHWYGVTAFVGASYDKLDDNQLFIPQLNVDASYLCQQAKCTELDDPVMIVRKQYSAPQWTPESSKEAQ
ncbi:hypothetical protein [Motilimonas eburnea]|uniref:hypothetical protein n=1 Tax=Motilimonas eburnea TaxID=1737488 RepID=UPI001E5BDC74|nr:hypothetical protein [Motilimonas eburnea]MCE2571140.1 hypothetical protein [Motilimonas eburnea]